MSLDPAPTMATSWPRLLCSYGLLLLSCLFLITVYLGTKGLVHSEAELLKLSVLHPLFNTEEHFAVDFWKPSMRQSDRLHALTVATHSTANALEKVGIHAFLESAGLIGWLRHNRSQLPWDSDGDLGILEEECLKSGATKEDFSRALGSDFAVLKFACSCQEDCEGDNRRMVGRVAHTTTGVCIDLFAYGPVSKARPWQKDPRYSQITWWERKNDHADFTFPRDSLLPLQDDVFADASIRIPANPRDFLSWEYGQCLGAHVWPWRMLLYTPQATEALHLILALKGAVLLLGSSGMNVFPPFVLICCMAAAVAILKSGLLYVSILFLSLCESVVLFLRPDWCIFRRLHSAIIVLVVAMCLHALQGSIQQLICQLDDFYLHPRRPKSWTLCLLGRCWDF